jgi:DNA-binding XRE family transcriptional regulator
MRDKPIETAMISPETAAERIYDRDDLSSDGTGEEVVSQGMWMALINLIAPLKERREKMGLTIAEVARRARLTVVTVSRLENLHNRNPSFDTVFRYAMALDALVTLGFEAIEPEDEQVV